MPITGDAKREYQRAYMRARRGANKAQNEAQSKPQERQTEPFVVVVPLAELKPGRWARFKGWVSKVG
jgi:hypothetical protein